MLMERKSKMMLNSQHPYGGGEDYGNMVGGFSWPPRCYTCSFCKREFRSAQALGGHMNVHRRDRARLRLSSPPPPPQPPSHIGHILNLNLTPNPNPNPNPNFSLPPLVSAPSSASPPSPAQVTKGGFQSSVVDHNKVSVRLNLEIGSESKEDLDLELRLGYSC